MADDSSQSAAHRIVQEFILLHRGAIVANMFEAYRQVVMDAGAPPIQVLECKLAFFGGARALLDLISAAMDAADEVTERDEEIMEAISAELNAYATTGELHAIPTEGNA